MGPGNGLSFCAYTTAWLAPEILGSIGSSPHLWFCAFKTAALWPQLLVSMGPRPHLWFSACKTSCLASELLVSGSQTSPVDLCNRNGVLTTRIASLYLSQTSSVHFCEQNSLPYKSLWVPDLTCGFVKAKQRPWHQNNKSPWVPAITCGFCVQNRDFRTRIASLYGSQTSPVAFVHAKERDYHQNF